jgi:hypothetical protein
LGIQAAITLVVDLSVLQLRLVLQQRAFGLEQGVLVRPRVDFRQQVAGLDHLPFLEGHLDQLTGHPAAHIDGVQRGDGAQRLVIQREVPARGRRHPHRDRPARATKPRPHRPAATGVSGRGLLPGGILWGGRGRPELPAQADDGQQDKQAKQPATGVAGNGGLHGVINHWARGDLFQKAER